MAHLLEMTSAMAWLPWVLITALTGTLGHAADDTPTAKPPKPAKLSVRGFGLLGNRQLTKIMRLARAEKVRPEYFDADFVEDGVLILLARLEETGHLEPEVIAQMTLRDGRELEHTWNARFETILPRPLQIKRLVFRARPGVRYYYDRIDIAGLESMTPADAQRHFISTEGLLQLKSMRVYTPGRLNDSIRNLRENLSRRGYADARVEVIDLRQDDLSGAVRVNIQVEQGLLTMVRSLRTEVFGPGEAEPRQRSTNELNTPYSLLWEQNFIHGQRTNQYRMGYPDVAVSLTPLARETNANLIQLDLDAIVQIGPRMRVGQLRFEGQRRTHPRVIENRLPLDPGDWLDPLEVERGRQRLARLGAFDRVEVRYEQADASHRDITYELEEAETLGFSVLLGYGSYEQLRGGIEFEQRNMFGLAHDFRVRGIQSFKSSSGDLRYTIPQLFGEEFDLFGYAAGLHREEISFTRREFGGGVGVARYFAPIQSDANLRYDYQVLNADDISPDTAEEVGLSEARVAAFVLDLRHDRRDSPLVPRRGLRLFANSEFASTALGGEVDYQRILLGGSYHLRLGGGRYLHLGVTHGLSFTAGGTDLELPFNKRFFPGGQNSVRGFQEGEAAPRNAEGDVIGAETFLQGNLELEQMLTPNWSVVAFTDAVGFARSRDDYPFDEELYSVGGGIRWKTLVGPIRLEYGYNLNPRRHDPTGTLHFSIGFPF
ncbi:MAG: BamA/TamA family outer membrane protein [Verrucomicrobia bacterium]|nr:BamA/TamA family outer membrane protein [Verrucomicrobiota bacterium]